MKETTNLNLLGTQEKNENREPEEYNYLLNSYNTLFGKIKNIEKRRLGFNDTGVNLGGYPFC